MTTKNDDVVRARIEKRIKSEATAVLSKVGLTPSSAYRMMMIKIATEKRLPFELLIPNETTIAAMNAAREGDLVTVGSVEDLMADLNADD